MEEEKKGEVNNSDEDETDMKKEMEEAKPALSPDEMNQIVMEAFNRTILESVEDSELPLEPSDFLKKHFSQFHMNDGSVIDLKLSTYKKIGKLLDTMARNQVLEYTEPKNFGHKVITSINRAHKQ